MIKPKAMTGTLGNNPADPLLRTEEAQRELLRRFGEVCGKGEFPYDAVIGAAINLLVNAIRQAHPTKDRAEARYLEVTAKHRGVLLEHFDAVTGNRKSIFPFDQHLVQMARFDDRGPNRAN